MSLLTRAVWIVPCLVAACGSTTVHMDTSQDGGDDRSTGGVHSIGGSGGSAGAGGSQDGGLPQASGGFYGGEGGFMGGDGAVFGGDGGFGATGGFFGGDGGFFGGDGGFGIAGGIVGTGGGIVGAGGKGDGAGGRIAVDPACCEAIPFCRAGYDQVSGPGECNAGDICYEATACCSTIWCKARTNEDAGACAEQAPPGVHYVSANASVCDRRAWTCPTNTYQYWDTCGCGCNQDPACPATVDCKPTTKDPLCTDNATCPYTARAF
ncbi:MAG TPA: hypothetical protein VH062_32640 [Polyangiaceae bacterium]|nr:hypothetical protein [Polyangiaceae bacterium]